MRINTLLVLSLALLFQACSSLFFYPDKQVYRTPDFYELKYDDVYFDSKDGTTLHAWHIYPKQDSKGLVFVAHGNAQNLSAHFVGWVWLVEQGYELFMFDYRAYGKSDGESDLYGSVEDTIAAMKTLERRVSKPYVAIGQSLGGTMLLNALVEYDKARVKGVVIDSTFVGFSDIASEKMDGIWLTWPFQWIPYLSMSSEYDAKDRVSQLNTPLLFVHGSLDQTISANHSWQLFELANRPRELWIVKEKGHLEVFEDEQVRESLLEFFNAPKAFYAPEYSRMKIYE